MKFIQGKNRHQLELLPTCLDDLVEQENEVRVIDLFVDSLKLDDFGFRTVFDENGRPAYHPSDLLKLFLYGYLNRIRSSRALERECGRNIELKWLMKDLVPDHNTISNFRKTNPDGIRKVFKSTVEVAKNFNLIGKKLIAGDSTKLRAQNSKENNYSQKKLARKLANLEQRLKDYTQLLAEHDGDNSKEQKKEINKKILEAKRRSRKYQRLQQQLKQSGEHQISTSDPDSRQMVVRNTSQEVAYNVQATADGKCSILLDYQVINQTDINAMSPMLSRAAEILGTTEFTALYDAGYHSSDELKRAKDLGIEVIVACPPVKNHAPNHLYDTVHFTYNPGSDSYSCPQGHSLTTTNRNYFKKSKQHRFKIYKTKSCTQCPFRSECTISSRGRIIERHENAALVDENQQHFQQNRALYDRRRAIIEHPFGTIKRQWDYSYIMTKKTKERASADVGLIFTAYNLRRIMKMIDKDLLKAFLDKLGSHFRLKRAFIKSITHILAFPKTRYDKCHLHAAIFIYSSN